MASQRSMPDLDETAVTEITIQPDGRVFIFGLSRQVAELLLEFCPAEHPVRRATRAPTMAQTAISPLPGATGKP